MARYSDFNIKNVQHLNNFIQNKCNNWHLLGLMSIVMLES